MHSDALTKKGVLFARIHLPEGYLNLFTTHTQASYITGEKNSEMPSYYVRLKQLLQAKQYIDAKLSLIAGKEDLNLFVGDLNVNANEKSYPIDNVLELFENGRRIKEFLNTGKPNEWDLMMYIFNNTKGDFQFKDCMYEVHNTFKVTYGDALIDDDRPLVS